MRAALALASNLTLRRRGVVLCILVALTALLLGGQQKGQPLNTQPSGLKPLYKHMHALIVGIDKYPNVPQLHYAVADATAMKAMLLKYGFKDEDITVLKDEDATKDHIREKLEDFVDADKVKPDDCVLFVFSGHGATVTRSEHDQMGYLLPYGAKVDMSHSTNEGPYRSTCLSMEEVWQDLDISPAKHVLVIADACYSGLLAEGTKGLSKPEIEADLQGKVREVITAGGEGETAGEDAAHKHGYLTAALLGELGERLKSHEAFKAHDMLDIARAKVLADTHSQQKPLCRIRSGEGEFLFAPGGLMAPDLAVKPDAGGELSTVVTMRFEVVDRGGRAIANPGIEVDGKPLPPGRKIKNVDLEDRKTQDVAVAIHAPGFQPKFIPVTLKLGKESPVSAILEASRVPTKPTTKTWAKGGLEVVYVPEGDFTMGDADSLVHKVHLDAYWIGKNDVTVAQFKMFTEEAHYKFDWVKNKPSWGWEGHDNDPMVNVTWADAEAFCKWAGGDLPTEAQWEKAARGDDGRVYPWGDEWDASKCSNSVGAKQRSTSAVGSFPTGGSPYGCLDMAGNVWQWCLDWYGDYGAGATKNPTGPASGSVRVLRGGSWSDRYPGFFLCAYRGDLVPAIRGSYYGFRLAGRP